MNCLMLILLYHLVRYNTADTTDNCRSGVNIADNKPLGCESCTGRCGQKFEGCSCDIACIVYQDCCSDFQNQCPQLHTTGIINAADFIISGSSCVSIRKTLYGGSSVPFGVLTHGLMVTKCLSDNVDCEYSFEDIPTILRLGAPVFHRIYNVTYVNGKCARCNGIPAQNLEQLPMELACNSPPILDLYSDESYQNIFDSSVSLIEDLMASGVECYASFSFFETLRGCSLATIRSCPNYCLNTNLTKLCTASGIDQIADTSVEKRPVYKNIYCALCNGVNMSMIQCQGRKIPSADPPSSFSLSLHFNLNHNYDVHMEIKTLRCKENGIFPGGLDCRRANDEFGSTSSNHTCSKILNFSLVQSFGDFKDKNDCNTVGTQYISETLSAVFLVESIGTNDHSPNSTCISWFWKCKVSSDNNFAMFITFSGRDMFKEDKTTILQTKLSTLMWNLSDVVIHEVDLKFVSYSIVFGMEKITVFRNQGQMEDCTGITLSWDDYQLENIHPSLLQCLADVYQSDLKEFGSIVCVENMESLINVRMDYGLGYLSITLSMISLLCLIIRLCLQECNISFQTKSGKIQFHLALSLVFGIVFLLTSPLAKQLKYLCSILAGLKYLCFLSSFVWMTSISISLWFTFRPHNLSTAVDSVVSTEATETGTRRETGSCRPQMVPDPNYRRHLNSRLRT